MGLRSAVVIVGAAASLWVAASADAAIYQAVAYYDDEQVLTYDGYCLTGSVAYVEAPANAYNIHLVKPNVGDPILDPTSGAPVGRVTLIGRNDNQLAVYADPTNCDLWGSGRADTRIEYTQRERLDGHCTDGDENLASHGGFLGHIVATNVRCDTARTYVQRFRFHGAGVGATFRYRGYRCHVSGHPEAATIRCKASRRRSIRWNIGD